MLLSKSFMSSSARHSRWLRATTVNTSSMYRRLHAEPSLRLGCKSRHPLLLHSRERRAARNRQTASTRGPVTGCDRLRALGHLGARLAADDRAQRPLGNTMMTMFWSLRLSGPLVVPLLGRGRGSSFEYPSCVRQSLSVPGRACTAVVRLQTSTRPASRALVAAAACWYFFIACPREAA